MIAKTIPENVTHCVKYNFYYYYFVFNFEIPILGADLVILFGNSYTVHTLLKIQS